MKLYIFKYTFSPKNENRLMFPPSPLLFFVIFPPPNLLTTSLHLLANFYRLTTTLSPPLPLPHRRLVSIFIRADVTARHPQNDDEAVHHPNIHCLPWKATSRIYSYHLH